MKTAEFPVDIRCNACGNPAHQTATRKNTLNGRIRPYCYTCSLMGAESIEDASATLPFQQVLVYDKETDWYYSFHTGDRMNHKRVDDIEVTTREQFNQILHEIILAGPTNADAR